MSGGGYRSMLFHAGAIHRLNELGFLGTIDFVSSVSGGSIAAAHLGLRWSELTWETGVATNLEQVVVEPLLHLAGTTIDSRAVARAALQVGTAPGQALAREYRRLFGDATLQDLPRVPRFIITATNLQTAVFGDSQSRTCGTGR